MDSENNTQVELDEALITPPSSIVVPATPPPTQESRRRNGPSLLTLFAIVVVGSMIGGVVGGLIVYLGRPYLDQQLVPLLAAAGFGGLAAAQPEAVAMATTVPPTATANGVNPAAATNEPAAPAAAPALISPTPDRSPEINDFVVSNTRHFTGNPEAKVTIIEFSDFK